MKFIIKFLCLSSMISSLCWAESKQNLSSPTTSGTELYYPELQVSPRATERILMEAHTEEREQKLRLLPHQISAFSTLLAGLMAPKPTDPQKSENDDVKYSRQVAIGVGLSWLAFSYFFNENYTPYSQAAQVIRSLPEKTTQDQLVRERIAEEHIQGAASLGRKIAWASAATNLAASIYLAGNSSNEGKVYAAVAGVASLAPLVFVDRWRTVNHYHQEYKKKIYAPIAMPTIMLQSGEKFGKSASLMPGFSWQMSF